MIYRIRSYHGGIGDELQFSTLPEYLTELGHEVYLLSDPEGKYVRPFRNEEIKKLIYDCNPFIKGEMEGNWDYGDLLNIQYVNITGNFIKNWEHALGLEPKHDLPKIYYRPTKIDGINGLIELSSITLIYYPEIVLAAVQSIMDQYPDIEFKQIISKHQGRHIDFPGMQQIPVEDIFRLTDCIHSSDVFISLNSGAHAIGCSIRHFDNHFIQYCLIPDSEWEWIIRDKKFIFDIVNYIRS
jgi:hypothetical protein